MLTSMDAAALTVRLVAGTQNWVLRADAEPTIIPSGAVVLSIAGSRHSWLLLDGRRVHLSGGHGVIGLDLTLSTGYHRLDVGGQTFWFGTSDAKLGLQGIEEMLTELRTIGTGWSGQVLFSDGSGLRDPHVTYGWLDEFADTGLQAISAILTAPRTQHRKATKLSRRGGAKIDRAATLRLLRSSPRQYLSPADTGGILVGEQRYHPLRVVRRAQIMTLDTVANRRAVSLLVWLRRLVKEVIDQAPGEPAGARTRLWRNMIETLAERPLARMLRHNAVLSSFTARTPEEATEPAYRVSFQLAREVGRLFGWSASISPSHRYSYVQQSNTIYQAYVATLLAAELGLSQTHPVLGSQPVAFSGPGFDLYYDTPPPRGVLRSWRSLSELPDDSRPDLLLHERDTGKVAVLDAKYRVARDGTATENSRKDVTAYMGLYGLSAVSILYPGTDTGRVVAGAGQRIVEVPARPGVGVASMIPAILATLEEPVYR